MCKAIDDMRKHSREEGRYEGRAEGRASAMLQVYHNMIQRGYPEDEARLLSGVTDEMLANEKKS